MGNSLIKQVKKFHTITVVVSSSWDPPKKLLKGTNSQLDFSVVVVVVVLLVVPVESMVLPSIGPAFL